MTGFMLDTDISSYIIKRRPAALAEKFEKHGETLNVSVITAAELRFGAEKAARPQSGSVGLIRHRQVYSDFNSCLVPRPIHAARNHRHR